VATISNSYLIRVRASTETQWALDDPILADGEPAYSSDVNQWKIGDGSKKWSELTYVYGPQGPEGPVGPEGPPAPSVDFQGSVPTSGDLPGTGELGHAYLVTDPDPDEMWVYGSGGWVYAGVAGIPGPEGPEGPQGEPIQEVVVTSIEPTDPEVDIWVHPTANLDTWGMLDDRYVNADGDSMSGDLEINKTDPRLDLYHGGVGAVGMTCNVSAVLDIVKDGQDPNIEGTSAYAQVRCADPTASDRAATKGYVDSYDPPSRPMAVGQDLNALKDTGLYFGYDYTNGPIAGNIHTLRVERYSNDWGTQIFTIANPEAPRQWMRSWTGTGGATWSAWYEVARRDYVDGLMKSATTSVNTSSGQASISHGLGVTPAAVVVSIQTSQEYVDTWAHVTARNSSTFTVGVKMATGADYNGQIWIAWIATA